MRFQTPTILHLILLGFLVVLTPLILGIGLSFTSLQTMSQSHSRDLHRIAHVTRTTRTLSNHLQDMERALRQFRLVPESGFQEVYNISYDDAQSILGQISIVVSSGGIRHTAELLANELLRFKGALDKPMDGPDIEAVIAEFERPLYLSEILRKEARTYLNDLVSNAEDDVDEVSREVLILSGALVPATILLILIFVVLIMRPLKQIDEAIRRLGQGDYEHSFIIQGPSDLQQVASRLAWLGQRLAKSEQEKQRFLRHISHELKTPLATIKEGTGLLKDEVPGPLNEEQKEVTEILDHATSSFHHLIDNLLDYTLLKEDPAVSTSSVDLLDLFEDILKSHALTAQRKKLLIHTKGKNLIARVDRSQLRTAVDNLISNAVHYTPKGGEIWIRWKLVRTSQLFLSVRDSGPGIPLSERDHVFKPFYQGINRKNGPVKGTGIGLSVAKECIEAHGGKLIVADSSQGANFEMTIPGVVEK